MNNRTEATFNLKKSLDHLLKLHSAPRISEDIESYEIFVQFKNSLHDEEIFLNENYKYFSRPKLDILFVKLLFYFAEICDEFVGDIRSPISARYESEFNNATDRKFLTLENIIFILNKITDAQFNNETMFNFNKKLINVKLIEACVAFFRHEKFVKMRSKISKSHDLLIGILCIIRNLTENPYYGKKLWTKYHLEDELKKLDNKASPIADNFDKLSLEIIANLNQKDMTACLESLTRAYDAAQIIDDEICFRDILFIKFIVKKPIFKEYDLFIKHDCLNMLELVMGYLSNLIDELNFTDEEDIITEKTYEPHSLNSRRVSIIYNLLIIINDLIFRSMELNVYFFNYNLIKTFVCFLSQLPRNGGLTMNKKRIISLIVNNLFLLTRFNDLKCEWLQELAPVETLLKLVDLLKVEGETENKNVILNTFYLVGNLINDKQLEEVYDINYCLEKLLDELDRLINLMELAKTKGEQSNLSQALNENLTVLIRFSVNDRSKEIIFKKENILKRLILQGARDEKVSALKLLTQLCYFESICEKISLDDNLRKQLRYISLNSKYLRVRKSAQTLLWWLDNRHKEPRTNFVYLSFNVDKKKICSKIRYKLEKNAIRVATAEESNEHSIETIGNLIKDSSCVIVCVCEKYRCDERNQAEARYAIRLNKPLIGVILNNGQVTESGWLFDLLCHKPVVEFHKNDFNLNVKNLLKEIRNIMEQQNKVEKIEKWTPCQVNDWFFKNQVHESIIRLYKTADGIMLKQVHSIKMFNPEFYYQTLANETDEKLKSDDILHFSQKLDQLFCID